MGLTLLGKKIGMTRVYNDANVSVPVTVIEVGPCVVTQVRTDDRDGYAAVQVGYGEIKPRRSTMAMIAHDAKAGTTPKRVHIESRLGADEASAFETGQTLGVDRFEGVAYVDVIGVSKGKGFAGTMKRHNFKGFTATHGTERKHRAPGSIGGLATNRGFSGKLKKGKRMSGHLGAERVTARSLDVVRIDAEKGLLLVKGPVPGPYGSVVEVRPAIRLNKSKAKKAAAK
ncbi:MAG TPA: 50S ribosomal protein L3 [Phycisphaerales bacterium]|nr:50S ribosomal protein L3 [Phycisphaerales bacterium]